MKRFSSRSWVFFFCLSAFSLRGASDPWKEASSFFDSKKYPEATAAFSKLIGQFPQDARGYLGRGKAFWLQKKYPEAVKDLDEAVKLAPKNAEAYNLRALAYDDWEKFQEALEDFGRAIELSPANAVYHHNRASTFRALSQPEKALEDYGKAVEKNPKYAPSFSSRGTLHADRFDFAAAIADFTKVIEIKPEDANAYFHRADAFNALREDVAALDDYARAHALDPKNAKVLNNLGFFYLVRKQYDPAIAELTKAIELSPFAEIHYNNRGLAWLEKGDFEKAHADFDKALSIKEKYPRAYRNRAALWLEEENYGMALADSTASVEQSNGTEAKSYRIRASARFATGDQKGAEADMEKAFILGPQTPKGLAVPVPPQLLLEEKDAEAAWLAKDTPDSRARLAAARNAHAFAILDCQDKTNSFSALEEAAAYAKSAAVLQPDNAGHHFLAGLVFLELAGAGEKKASAMAAQSFTQAVDVQEDYAPAWIELALLSASEERPWEAMLAFENALEKDPAATAPYAVGPLCAMYAITGETLRGEDFFRELAAANPEVPSLSIGSAILLKHNGDDTAAAEILDNIIILEPPDSLSHEYAKQLLADWKSDL